MPHDDQLEYGPAQKLNNIDRRGEIRPANPENGPEHHHGRHAGLTSRNPRQGQEGHADQASEDDGPEGMAQREARDEKAACQEDQEPDPQVSPEHHVIPEPEPARRGGDRLDPPLPERLHRSPLVKRKGASVRPAPLSQPLRSSSLASYIAIL